MTADTPHKDECDLAEIKRRLQAAYRDDIARRESRGLSPWKVEVLAKFVERLRAAHERGAADGRRVADGRRCADLGAGPGLYAVPLRAEGFAVTCLDLSPEMAARCASKELPAVVGDFFWLPLANASLDAVWAMSSLLHVPKAHLREVLDEIARVLRPGGLCYLGFYRGHSDDYWPEDPLDPPRYFAMYQPDELRRAAQHPLLDLIDLVVVPLNDGGGDVDGHLGVTLRRTKH